MHDYLDNHQKKAFNALRILDAICEKHHFTYYLLAGSALGAIRHQGFIPWDDDIDVGLIYDDWYALREVLPKELEEFSEDFVYMDNIIDPNFPRFQGKILYQGETVVDVFILVKWPSNKLLGNIFWQIKRMATECYQFTIGYSSKSSRPTSIKQKIRKHSVQYLRKAFYYILHLFFNRDDFIKWARWVEKHFMTDDTEFYINIFSIYSMDKEMIKKEWLLNQSEVIFEDQKYPTVSDPDAYLTHLYGDYMSMPPVEKRVKFHEEKLI